MATYPAFPGWSAPRRGTRPPRPTFPTIANNKALLPKDRNAILPALKARDVTAQDKPGPEGRAGLGSAHQHTKPDSGRRILRTG